MVLKVEEDDHGHATLLVHGEPELIYELAQALILILAEDAEEISLPEELRPEDDDEEDLGSSS